MRRKQKNDYEPLIPYVRGFIGYLWIVVSFGCITLLVQSSLEEKEIRYQLGEKNSIKMDLQDRIRQVQNEITELERYERIAQLVDEKLPQLGPPSHPAIEIPVAGLHVRSGIPEFQIPLREKDHWINRMRSYLNSGGSIRRDPPYGGLESKRNL
jgi:hypothetical protein